MKNFSVLKVRHLPSLGREVFYPLFQMDLLKTKRIISVKALFRLISAICK